MTTQYPCTVAIQSLVVAVAIACVAVVTDPALGAEKFPEKPIQFMIPFDPGGQSDTAVILMRSGLEEKLGVDVVAQHRPGGGGAVGWTMLAREKPDGHTIAVTNLPHIIVQPLMTKGVQYKTEDLAPVYLYASSPGGIAVLKSDDRFKTLKDLIDFAKANPAKLSIGGTGKFTGNHLGYLQFAQMAGIDASYVSFSGAAPQTAALLGGHVIAIYGDTFIFSDKREELRVLAVATEKRLPDFPDAPTFKELGIDLVGGIDRGVTVPAGTPKERIKVLADAIRHAASKKEFIDGMQKLGFDLFNLGPDEFAAFIEKRKQQYVKVLKDNGFLK
jgi:tripartite-type tricarboxylate transporter receptor subunit TctC